MKIQKDYILLIVFLYIYLYNPVFQILDLGLIKILLLISIVYLFATKDINILVRDFKNEIILTAVLIVYITPFVIFGDGTAIVVPYKHILWFLESFIIPIFLLTYFRKYFENRSWKSYIIIAGTIASFITLFLILNPEINTWIREFVIIDSLDSSEIESTFRGFSIAEGSSFDYGIVQGLIFSICLFSIKSSYKYYIPLIPLTISILFNARIGFAVIIIAAFLLINFRYIKLKTIQKFVVAITLLILIIILLQYTPILNKNSKSIEWGLSFFENIFSFIKGESRGTYFQVFSKDSMLFFPESFKGLVFGEGRLVFGLKKGGSDLGYVNQIFSGGIIYLILMLFFLGYLYIRNSRNCDYKLYPKLFLLSLLVVNIKGSAFFESSGFFRLIMFYYILSVFKAKEMKASPKTA